jgi:phosphate-selective porin OprO and OprP
MRKSWLFMGVAVLTSAVLGFGSPARAEEAGSPEKSIEQRFEELDQEIRILKRQRELEQEAAEIAKKATPIVKASTTGFSLESADGQNVIKLRGLLQVDYHYYFEGSRDVRNRSDQRAGDLDDNGFSDTGDTWLLRRVRPIIQGTLLGIYDFRFTPDFAGNSATVVDAYIDARFHPAFKVRAGIFKSFVGLERLQSGADIKLMERSYVTNAILPNRDLGIAVHGDVFGDTLNYAFGLVNGVNDGAIIGTGTAYDGHPEGTGRLFATPFKNSDSVLRDLGVGVAATYTNFPGERNLHFTDTSAADGTRNGLPSYLSDGQNTFFRYNSTAIAYGERWRIAPQANYYNGPLGIIGEFVLERQAVSLTTGGSPPAGGAGSNTLIQPNTNKNLNHNAWQIAVSYILTGEDASFQGVKPNRNFNFGTGWGAWELVARYSEINLDNATFKNPAGTSYTGAYADLSTSAQSAHSWTAGVNWYLNPNVKVVMNYSLTTFDGGAGVGTTPINAAGTNVQDREDESAFFTRLQLAY